MLNNKTRIAVIFGGLSTEHDVSRLVFLDVIKSIDFNKNKVIPIEIAKNGVWYLHDIYKLIEMVDINNIINSRVKIIDRFKNYFYTNHSPFDFVMPLLLGKGGEDGTLQGMLETFNISYLGSSVLGSSVGMDKIIAKKIVQSEGVLVTPYLAINSKEWMFDPVLMLDKVTSQFNCPIFIKPSNGGSSIGVTKVEKISDVPQALEDCFKYTDRVLIEKALNVREFQVAVIEEHENLFVSEPGEVSFETDFFTYEAKYTTESKYKLLFPNDISVDLIEEIKKITRKLFYTLDCRDIARFDYFIDEENKLIFNEVNTMPVISRKSAYARLMKHVGIEYDEFIERLIENKKQGISACLNKEAVE